MISSRTQGQKFVQLFCLLLFTLLVQLQATMLAQVTHISYEIVESFSPFLSPEDPMHELAGYTCVDIYAHFTNPTDVLGSLYAAGGAVDPTHPMYINASYGCYSNEMFGDILGPVPSYLSEVLPSAEFSTRWMIGDSEDIYIQVATDQTDGANDYDGLTLCSSQILDGLVYQLFISCYNQLLSCQTFCGGDPNCLSQCTVDFAECNLELQYQPYAAGEDLKIRIARATTLDDIAFHTCLNVFLFGSQSNLDSWCMEGDGEGVLEIPITAPWECDVQNWAASCASIEEVCGPGTYWNADSLMCLPTFPSPWNPDADGNLLINTLDLLTFLTIYGLSDPDMDGTWE